MALGLHTMFQIPHHAAIETIDAVNHDQYVKEWQSNKMTIQDDTLRENTENVERFFRRDSDGQSRNEKPRKKLKIQRVFRTSRRRRKLRTKNRYPRTKRLSLQVGLDRIRRMKEAIFGDEQRKGRQEERIPLDQSLIIFSVSSGIVAAILSI